MRRCDDEIKKDFGGGGERRKKMERDAQHQSP
jgi:hypothetical protein